MPAQKPVDIDRLAPTMPKLLANTKNAILGDIKILYIFIFLGFPLAYLPLQFKLRKKRDEDDDAIRR